MQEVSEVVQPRIFSFSFERKFKEKTKTAGQIDGEVSFTAGQFAWCLALNEPLLYEQLLKVRDDFP